MVRMRISTEPAAVLAREDLYELVWSTPLHDLAEHFGTTTRDLATTCAGWRIPLPDRAWWRGRRQGTVGNRRALPVDASATRKIPIYPTDPRRWLSPEDQAEFQVRIANEKKDDYQVIVDGEATPRFAISAASRLTLRKLAETEGPIVESLVRVESADCIPRALRILAALADAFRRRQYVIVQSQNLTPKVLVWDEAIAFHIQKNPPPRQQVPRHKPTPSIAKPELAVHSGKLELLIDERVENERTTFSDGERRPLENCLNNFLAALLQIAMRRRAERSLVAAERQIEEAREMRPGGPHGKQETREKVNGHYRAVIQQVARFRRVQSLRELMAAVKQAATRADEAWPPELERWLHDMNSICQEIDPVPAIIRSS